VIVRLPPNHPDATSKRLHDDVGKHLSLTFFGGSKRQPSPQKRDDAAR
jgi:hypothetical protein